MANNQVYHTNGGGDEQYTPAKTVELLLPHIRHLKSKTIWLPFDREDSQFVKVLTENGFKVVYSHIDYGQDFFEYEPSSWDVIISNPPYKNKRAYWERCLSFGKPFALLLPINILSDSVINVSLRERERERERETVAHRSYKCSYHLVERGFTMPRPEKSAILRRSRPHISVLAYSTSKLYLQI